MTQSANNNAGIEFEPQTREDPTITTFTNTSFATKWIDKNDFNISNAT